jgi:hypothetical protein
MREYCLVASISFHHARTAVYSDLTEVDFVPNILFLVHSYSKSKLSNSKVNNFERKLTKFYLSDTVFRL